MNFHHNSILSFNLDTSEKWCVVHDNQRIAAHWKSMVIGWAVVYLDDPDMIVDESDEPEPNTEIQPVILRDGRIVTIPIDGTEMMLERA